MRHRCPAVALWEELSRFVPNPDISLSQGILPESHKKITYMILAVNPLITRKQKLYVGKSKRKVALKWDKKKLLVLTDKLPEHF